ncbi:MAG: leucine--tRNA ligase [Bacteroidetes bacterium]|nr:leucine--tRNA ligase [Bacteroidota bacterium]
MEYNFREIEEKWRAQWKADKQYKVETPAGANAKPKFYVLDMFPYPSGAGLHVGHPLGYIASDIYSRYKRLKGFNVLHPMGFDSFGLPAEQYAIETGQHPAVTTEKNIATFKSQLDKIGFCYDWDREVRTSEPGYYKWTQWLFLQLFNSYFCNTQKKARPIADLVKKYETSGSKNFTAAQWNAYTKKEQEDILMKRRLAYSAYGEVNWCEALGTVLANDEVVNGVSERGGFPVVKKKMKQWYLRITAYADRLLEGLEKVAFSESMKEMQRNWIGKSEGAEVSFAVKDAACNINVYTTRPDTIFGVDFLVLAPEHELVQKITTVAQKGKVEDYLTYVKSRSDRERMAEVKQVTGCFTGAYAVHPFSGKPIPVWIAEYVLAGYGTGAIMAVPCGDQRDYLFAKHFNIPVTNIIGEEYNGSEANPTKDAVLQQSDFLDGLKMKDAIGVAINKIEEAGIGKRKVNFRMRDAGFSRQRYWGEPFPIVWEDDVAIALDESELPLTLPHVDAYGPGPEGEGPLANIKDWVEVKGRLKEQEFVDLTPDPSPKERGTMQPDRYGYMNSSVEEWKNTIRFAKENRKDPTLEEDIIWQRLRNRQVEGCKFRRQHPVAGYIPDFICLEKKLIVEVDGAYHNAAEQVKFDIAREKWLAEYGYVMVRITNEEINNNVAASIEKIKTALRNQPDFIVENELSAPLLGRGVGGEVKRETSTMPGYAGSSWYFLRYMDPHNDQTFCDRHASNYWNQVDVYVGGTEHAVGHLLYSRMWTKVMYDLNLIGFDEPFKKLVNQGMIQGSSRFVYRVKGTNTFVSGNLKGDYETDELHVDVNIVDGVELDIDSFKKWKTEFATAEFILENGRYICGVETEKMSKRYYNTVDPVVLTDKYGADTFRMYEMFLGPVEQSKPWDTKGIEGVHRFLRKLWRLFFDEMKGRVWNTDAATDAELKVLHKTIKKIESDTENFSFNTAVSAFMIAVNELFDLKCHKKEILEKVLILLTPYAPHIAEELWQQLGNEGSILNAVYPVAEEKYLVETSKEYPISVNGKLRTTISMDVNALQPEVEQIVLENDIIQKWLEGKSPKKIIFVKGKMVNVVV